MATNQAQREQWNNADQAKVWPRRERITVAVTAHLLDALTLRAGERVLEVGSGGGLVAIEAAKAVTASGAVTGFDLSAPLVGLATQRAADAGAANVNFVAGDAQTDDIPGAPFDVAMSQFGVMFFADPAAAFANIRRHLRPGARIGFASWQSIGRNRWFPGSVLASYQTPPAPNAGNTPPPGPFAFAEPDYVRGVLERAGFSDVSHRELAIDVAVPEDSMYGRDTVDAMKLDPEKTEQAWKDLQAFASSLRGPDGQLHLRLAPQLFSAENPK